MDAAIQGSQPKICGLLRLAAGRQPQILAPSAHDVSLSALRTSLLSNATPCLGLSYPFFFSSFVVFFSPPSSRKPAFLPSANKSCSITPAETPIPQCLSAGHHNRPCGWPASTPIIPNSITSSPAPSRTSRPLTKQPPYRASKPMSTPRRRSTRKMKSTCLKSRPKWPSSRARSSAGVLKRPAKSTLLARRCCRGTASRR